MFIDKDKVRYFLRWWKGWDDEEKVYYSNLAYRALEALYGLRELVYEQEKTEANAKAKMLIYLIENKLIEAKNA